jgi:hypothetical protein
MKLPLTLSLINSQAHSFPPFFSPLALQTFSSHRVTPDWAFASDGKMEEQAKLLLCRRKLQSKIHRRLTFEMPFYPTKPFP